MLYNEAGSNTLLWSRVDLGHKMPSVCLLWCDYGTVVFRWLKRRTRWIHPKIPARKSQGHKKSEAPGIDPRKNDRSFYEWPNSIPFPFLIIFSPHALATKPVFFPWHFFWSFPGLLQTSIDKGIAFSLPFLCLLHQAAAKTDSLSLNLKLSFFFNWVIPARSGWVPSPEWLAFTHQLVRPVSSESWCVTGRQLTSKVFSTRQPLALQRMLFPFLSPPLWSWDTHRKCMWLVWGAAAPSSCTQTRTPYWAYWARNQQKPVSNWTMSKALSTAGKSVAPFLEELGMNARQAHQ